MKRQLKVLAFLIPAFSVLILSCNNRKKEDHTGHGQAQDIDLETLLRPSNAFVISTIPVTTIGQREEALELAVVGTVSYDTRQVGSISSRVGGRIEKLYVRYKYQPVKKGQKIMDIYSPELVTAQQNLLFLLRNDPGNSSMIDAAKDRLLLLGMSQTQLNEVIRSGKPGYSIPVFSNYSGFVTTQELPVKEGTYVQAGQAIFSIYDPGAAWILLDIFPDQHNALKVGDAVRIVPETAPAQNFRASIDYLEPVFRPGSKTLTARVYFNNAVLKLPIGSRVTANIFTSTRTGNWLPKESILSLGRDRIVFIKEMGGFRPHKVNTGIELKQLIEVTGGLNKSDSVAVNAQYLVDNEAFIKVN